MAFRARLNVTLDEVQEQAMPSAYHDDPGGCIERAIVIRKPRILESFLKQAPFDDGNLSMNSCENNTALWLWFRSCMLSRTTAIGLLSFVDYDCAALETTCNEYIRTAWQ